MKFETGTYLNMQNGFIKLTKRISYYLLIINVKKGLFSLLALK